MGRDGSGVRPASRSSIEITFVYRGVRCRERIALKPTATNLKRAERHRAAILDAIDAGTFDYKTTFPSSPRAEQFDQRGPDTVASYMRQWLADRRPEIAASTAEGYKKIIEGQIIPALGQIRLADLKRADVRDWLRGKDVSRKRLGNIVSPLRYALRQAADDELISANPLQGWTPMRREPPKPDPIDPLTADEQSAILKAAGDPGQNLLQFGFWTGMRVSELIALQWDDIDWRSCEAAVSRARTQAGDAPETTKTPTGSRRVTLLAPAMDALRAQLAWSRFHPSGCVWLDPRHDDPWVGDQALRKSLWKPALRKAGVRYRYPYQMRHTFASMMLSAGEPVMWVAAQLGHTDWAFTARTYSRWMPESTPDAGQKAMAKFGQNGNAKTTSRGWGSDDQ